MKTNEQLLKELDWEPMIGYILDYEKDPDHNNVFVSREDVIKFYNEEPKTYYWNEHYDSIHEECSALECAFDDWCDRNIDDDQDLHFDQWLEFMKK